MTKQATTQAPEPLLKLCQQDNWTSVLDDPAPRAVRWATRKLERMFSSPDWTMWHYTEGNGAFTACSRPVVPFEVDGSPQDGELDQVTCRVCRAKMKPFTALLAKMENGTATAADVAPTWQVDYSLQYHRTTGQTASFDSVGKGGWTVLRATHADGVESSRRVQRGEVLAMTKRLSERPDFEG